MISAILLTLCLSADARVVPCPVCEPVEHEACHQLHARLRSQYGSPAVYVGDGRAVVIPEVRGFRLTDLARAIPERMRGPVYNLYLRQQARWWDQQPSYLLDEWASYLNGTEWHRRNNPGNAAYSLERAREMQRYAKVLVAKAKAAGGDCGPLEQAYERLAARTDRLAGVKAVAPKPKMNPPVYQGRGIVCVSGPRCYACQEIKPLWSALQSHVWVVYLDIAQPWPAWAGKNKPPQVPTTYYFDRGKVQRYWVGADAYTQKSIADTLVPGERVYPVWPEAGAPAPLPKPKAK